MATRAYYLHQAQVCQSLALSATDPALKDRYEKLALEFLDKASETDDSDDIFVIGGSTSEPDNDTSPEQ